VLGRRRWLLQASVLAATSSASALGRIPYGGEIQSSLPWDLQSVDPHDLNDPVAAFLAPLLFEPLFGLDGGQVYPTLAASYPTRIGEAARVELRSMRWPNGKPVTAEQA